MSITPGPKLAIVRNHIYRYNVTITGTGSSINHTIAIHQDGLSSNVTYNLDVQ